MGLIARVELPFKTGLAKDIATNTFAIGEGDGPMDATDIGEVAAVVADFYRVAPPGHAQPLGFYMSPVIKRGATDCVVKMYRLHEGLTGLPSGSPIHTMTFDLPDPPVAVAFPDEVSVCVTLEADGRQGQQVEVADGTDSGFAPDRPRQRFTGRVYVGPLTSDTRVQDATLGTCRVATEFQDLLREGVKKLATDVMTVTAGTGLGFLGVWSRKDARIRQVGSVVTDDAYDTQRRRGLSALVRTRETVSSLLDVELAA